MGWETLFMGTMDSGDTRGAQGDLA
jgi:hypothetical protein